MLQIHIFLSKIIYSLTKEPKKNPKQKNQLKENREIPIMS